MIDYTKYVWRIGMFFGLAYAYNQFHKYTDETEEGKTYRIVKQYLIKQSSIATSKLPILWIYMEYPQNARHWKDFYSRNTTDLNQPYLYLTLKTIIDKCSNTFNVCLIDDTTLFNIIPGWNIYIHEAAEPIQSKLRDLAKAYILKYYGGMFVPSSFLCLKNLGELYYSSTCGHSMFVGELQNYNSSSVTSSVCANKSFIGAHKGTPLLDEYISYLQELISTDYTSESIFKGNADLWLQDKVDHNQIHKIHAKHLGAKDNKGKDVKIDDLIGNSYIDFDPLCVGIYFPQNDILERSSYQWFARLNAKQVLDSDTVMGKLLLTKGNLILN